MVVTKKPSGRAMSMPGVLAVGQAVSITLTILLSLLLTKLILAEAMTMENIGYGILILLLAASFAGAVTAYKKVKHRKVLVCMLSGMVYYGTLLGITALFFGGQYTGMGVTGLLIFGGCGTAALMTTGKGSGGKSKKRKRR